MPRAWAISLALLILAIAIASLFMTSFLPFVTVRPRCRIGQKIVPAGLRPVHAGRFKPRNFRLQSQRLGMGGLYRLGKGRSEEHTSELQSRFDLVCRLLLEKKK